MSYNKTIWVNDETELNAENMNHIENGIEGSYNITLLAVSDVEPTECEEGDKYYNIEDKVIYTATATDTWGSTGTTPISDTLYVVFDEKNTYAWDGTDLVSVGGGSGSEIVIEPDEPTEDTKLIIEESDLDFQGLEIANEYTTGNNVAYSCDYQNKAFGGTILWTNNTPNEEISTKTIDLSSSDYDLLEIIFKQTTTLNIINSTKTIKGADGRIGVWFASDGLTAYRNLTRVSDTQYTLSTAVGGVTGNNYIIPLYIIGYKTGLFD